MKQVQIAQEIEELAQLWAKAEVRGDTAFMEQTLSRDFLCVGPLGFLLSKQDWIDRHQTGDLTYANMDLSEISVRVYQGAALLVGHLDQRGTYRGNPIVAQLRVTLAWVLLHERWQLAGYHVSPIGQPPGFRS